MNSEVPTRSHDFFYWTDSDELSIRAVSSPSGCIEALQGRTEVIVRDQGISMLANAFVDAVLFRRMRPSEALTVAWLDVVGIDSRPRNDEGRAVTKLVRRIAQASHGGQKKIVYDPDLIDDLVSTQGVRVEDPKAAPLAECFKATLRAMRRKAAKEQAADDDEEPQTAWTALQECGNYRAAGKRQVSGGLPGLGRRR